jgi:hypothetical protein
MRPACSLPQPIFRPGGGPAARLSFRLVGLGFPAAWAPLGAAGARAPPAAHGSRTLFAAGGEDGDGAGWAGVEIPERGTRRSHAEAVLG